MEARKGLEQTLANHLTGREAFMPVDEMLEKISTEQLQIRPKGLPYSFYEVFYHIWYTQRDILKYCLEPGYAAPAWPKDYWPKEQGPANEEDWEKLKKDFFEDRKKLRDYILAEENNLNEPVPSNKKHSIFREVLLVVEHTSYHSGQLLIILRLLGLHNS